MNLTLTGEWLDNLALTLRGLGDAPGRHKKRAEGRQFPRVGLRILSSAVLVENGKPAGTIVIHVRDISPQGIGITCEMDIREKQRFIIELPLEKGGKRRILCEVRNNRRLSARLYGIGAAFISTLNMDSQSQASSSKKDESTVPQRPHPSAAPREGPKPPVRLAGPEGTADQRAPESRRRMSA